MDPELVPQQPDGLIDFPHQRTAGSCGGLAMEVGGMPNVVPLPDHPPYEVRGPLCPAPYDEESGLHVLRGEGVQEPWRVVRVRTNLEREADGKPSPGAAP